MLVENLGDQQRQEEQELSHAPRMAAISWMPNVIDV